MAYDHVSFIIRTVVNRFATDGADELWIFVTFVFQMNQYVSLVAVRTATLNAIEPVRAEIFLFRTGFIPIR